MHIIQSPLFDFEEFIRIKRNNRLTMVLESLPVEKLLKAIEDEHRTGRNAYPDSAGDKNPPLLLLTPLD
jgi:hypothetical protein